MDTETIDDQCLNCIAQVQISLPKEPSIEGNCTEHPTWPTDQRTCGSFAISDGYYSKCGTQGENITWEMCANNVTCAKRCVTGFMSRYYRDCFENLQQDRLHKRNKLYCQDYAAMHSARSPDGCFKQNTDEDIKTYLALLYEKCPAIPKPPAANSNTVAIVVPVVVVAAVIVAVISGLIVWRKRKQASSKKTAMRLLHGNNYEGTPRTGNMCVLDPAMCGEKIQDLVKRRRILITNVEIGEEIGFGHFGQVRRAKYFTDALHKNCVTVAVKMLKGSEVRVIDAQAFVEEAAIMDQFDHPNILNLIGLIWEPGENPVMVLPFMGKGDLLSLVKKQGNLFNDADLLSFTSQILKGMEYLESLKFVHRDVALRNCLVNDYFVIKISDFGLARDTYASDMYECDIKTRQLPWKWLAPESMKHGIFTHKSDVWAFGVVMWELYTGGGTPYPAIGNMSVLLDCVEAGYRLSRPPNMSDPLFDAMTQCWKAAAEDRPSFKYLSGITETLLKNREGEPSYSYTPGDRRNSDLPDVPQFMQKSVPKPAPRKPWSPDSSTSQGSEGYDEAYPVTPIQSRQNHRLPRINSAENPTYLDMKREDDTYAQSYPESP